ncbi:DUF6577 family protein [Epilithonimonas hominis]|uniref:DUF6577 family protein n=1 Tax=Epilithonimonas hominis TaxID=420404 RepID=UPI0028A7FC3E|nr:DUF6577 family protein [Epilithonimonas hominis]
MLRNLEHHIDHYFKGSDKLSKDRLVFSIKKDFPSWSENTINTYLSKLKKDGVLNNPSRGIYEIENKEQFHPKIQSNLKRIYNRVNQEFPYISFCIWDTLWFNGFMIHQPFKNYVVLEVEKDASESVFSFLSQTMKNVFFNPDEEIFKRYIHNLDEAVIVKNLISESPLIERDKITIPALEKFLVDMLIDTSLFSAQQNEKEIIIKNVKQKFTLNEPKMRRYASRRNREKEIDELINLSLAKY